MMHSLSQIRSGELKNAKHLKLSCGLTEFPEEIFELSASLEILDLSGNQLSSLPANFGEFSKLKILFMSDNLFEELPAVLSDCKNLDMIGFKANRIVEVPEAAIPESTRWLILTNNKIPTLPPSIGKCMRLQKVALAGNELSFLPEEMSACKNLELLRISANKFKELPAWLLKLPRLAWLAFSGNPFCKELPASPDLPEICWKEFKIMEQLGEGASGNIFRAAWQRPAGEQVVAIKVFKGEVTSDGWPRDEINASILAGTHPGFPKLLGRIIGHPQQKEGLVMDLIPAAFVNLGLPPDLNSCSRDTFVPGTSFSANHILKVAGAIAAAMAHLHQRGIVHGDLYAHNILVDAEMNCLLSDFGAASFFQNLNEAADGLKRIEIRAFGCLLDDLLLRLETGDAGLELTQQLLGLRDACMNETPMERLLFDEVIRRLSLMRAA